MNQLATDGAGGLRSISLTEGVVEPAAGGRRLIAQPLEFREKYNLKPFQFKHTLAHSPLFSLSRLTEVAERMLARGDLEKFVARSAKSALSDAKFKDMPLKEKMLETVRQLAEQKTWLKLTNVDTADPEYAELLRQVIRELEELSGQPLSEMISWSGLTVFCASPGVTTPYHIDHQSNFLFQILGSKDVSLHNPNERDVVTDDQVERFYAGDFEAAEYRPEWQARGTILRLDPGTAVHHPPLAPHWVQNGENMSVSVSVGYNLKSLDRIARVYQVNYLLRRCGFEPTPPGKSKLRDQLKMMGIGVISKLNPTTPDEILFSGLDRLRAVRRWIRPLRNVP